MPSAISNTSPLLYLYRVGAIDWLPELFDEVWTPEEVLKELADGRESGFDVPNTSSCHWLKIVNPTTTPSEWLALDLGPGELATMALALEYSEHIVLLDDKLARRTAHAAGLNVWGTLKVVLESKSRGLVNEVEPVINRLIESGMWVSPDVKKRILRLADELN